MQDLSVIFRNNRVWIEQKLALDEQYFDNLSRGQAPSLLYIGCSDSRVSAEDLMGLTPGEVFVHRNIANLVPNLDFSSATVINYAVIHLGVKHIVICGHYFCGGVKAAMQPKDLGVLNPWLRIIRDVYRDHQDELEAIEDEDARYNRLVELNVEEQCLNVIKKAEVLHAINSRELEVHGWVFDIKSGRLKDLKIDDFRLMEGIEKVYKIN